MKTSEMAIEIDEEDKNSQEIDRKKEIKKNN